MVVSLVMSLSVGARGEEREEQRECEAHGGTISEGTLNDEHGTLNDER
jgi:hypothetical protein